MSIEDSIHRTNKILQDDEEFRVEVVEWQKRPGETKLAVLKSIQDSTTDRRLDGFQNESRGTKAFRRLARQHPEWGLVVPKTYAIEDTRAVRRFMKGEPILQEGTEFNDIDTTHARLAQLAELLAMIDTVDPDTSAPDDPRNSAPYNNMLVRVPIWAAEPVQQGLLSPEDLIATTELINETQPYLVPRYAHGDLMPYAHVFARPDGRLAFIDFEHYSAQKPRYYDAAYCYAQMYTKPSDPKLAGYFMGEFLESAQPTERQTEQMMPVLAQRAIRLFFDAAFVGHTKDDQQVKSTQQLLDLSLQGNIEALMDPPQLKNRVIIPISEATKLQSARRSSGKLRHTH